MLTSPDFLPGSRESHRGLVNRRVTGSNSGVKHVVLSVVLWLDRAGEKGTNDRRDDGFSHQGSGNGIGWSIEFRKFRCYDHRFHEQYFAHILLLHYSYHYY